MNAAFGDLSASVQSNSNSTAVRLAERANAKAEYDKDYYGAIQLYNDAINHCSQDCRIYLNRCLCYVKLGLFQLALDDAQHAIKLNPTLAKCYFRKGQALFGLKKYNDAEIAFKEVLILDNDCPETNQELVKVRYEALLSLGFDETSSSFAAHKYESIQEATEALLSGSLHRNVDLGLNLGSAAAARNVRDIWTLEQINDTRSNQIANYGGLSSSTYARASNVGQLSGSPLINSNTNLRHDLAYISGLEQASEASPITSVQLTPFSLNGHISSNGINSTVNFTKTNSNSNINHRSVPFRGNEFGFGYNENNAIDCGNNILNTLNSSKCSISNNQQNNHQLNVSQSISENVFGPSTSRSININESESGEKVSANSSSNGYLYNPFNQLPDSKLIDAIVPNLMSSGHITAVKSVNALVNQNSNSESGENINTSVPTLTNTSDFNVQDGNSNESITQLHCSPSTAPITTARHPTSYSDIVKRTKKAEGTKTVKASETHSNLFSNGIDGRVENGDSGNDRKNGCESPSSGDSKDTKQSSGNTNANVISNVPTNLWGYNGLRVANVSNSCSKSTLLSLFSKHGNVKLIERINNKIVENNLWVYYDNPTSPVEAIIRLQGAVIEGISVNGSQPLQLYFAPTNDQKDLKFSRPKQPPDSKGECYYWRTTNCFSRNNCDLLHIPANKNIDAQIWMKMKEPKDNNQDGVSLNGGH
ncbi:39S ribosomal protein L23-like protein [Leptotrombidium deliense]|uniref:39S ribosomal protein L23-like protein n=1 Tax=Leptotrombidium deliense TaxID=299467 RepID=A0A443SPD9_9ACAR|nr:39S ribosomal protein L23-like protein [Leptotrombidium deliense]